MTLSDPRQRVTRYNGRRAVYRAARWAFFRWFCQDQQDGTARDCWALDGLELLACWARVGYPLHLPCSDCGTRAPAPHAADCDPAP